MKAGKRNALSVGSIGALGLLLFCVGLLIAPSSALALPEHPFKETFGSAQQPSFNNPQALAVDQANGDLYVVDVGVNEVQSVTVSATAGKFELCFKGPCAEFEFSGGEGPSAEMVQTALLALPSIGGINVNVTGGRGNASGSNPYIVTFQAALSSTDVPQLECESSATEPLSGGSGCSVETSTPGVSSKVERFHPDGSPDNFSALASNTIDGLVFNGNPREKQIAVDSACALHEPPLTELTSPSCEEFDPADGDLYVTQARQHLVDVFGSDGSLLGQLTASSEGPFDEPLGVGADKLGALYVGSGNLLAARVHKFVPTANPPKNGGPPPSGDNTANFTSLTGGFAIATLAAGAGPSDGFIFVNLANGELFKLDSSSGEKTEAGPITTGGPTGVTTVTVDPESGHLYAAINQTVIEYDVSGSSPEEVSKTTLPSAVQGIAVDGATGNLYLDRAGSTQLEVFAPVPTLPIVDTEEANPVGATSATLRGTVNPNGEALKADPSEGCFFEWGETTAYGNIAPCEEPDAEEIGEGSEPVPVHADITELNPGTTYHFQLVAANEFGSAPGGDEALLTLGPSIKGQSVSQITATGARIGGEVNPNGKPTGFVVQYVTAAQFDLTEYEEATTVPTPFPNELSSGSAFVKVAQQLSGLAPLTTYHFRLVATNPDATSFGPDASFTTFAQNLTPLPDGRAYELVSPAQKGGEVFPPAGISIVGGSCDNCLPGLNAKRLPMQSAADGEGVLYEGQPFSGGLASGANEYLGARSSGGWGTEALSTPLFSSLAEQGGYQGFSADFSRSVLFQIEPALSPDAATDEKGKAFANLYLREANGSLQPVITTATAPPNRDPGIFTLGKNAFVVVFGGANSGTEASPALSHVVFAANDALTEEVEGIAPAAPEIAGGGQCRLAGEECNLYEWAGGELRLVNVLPDNETAAVGAVIGSGRQLGPNPTHEAPDVDHAVSEDGSRIFFSVEPSGQVYVRIDGTETVEIDDTGAFLTASADGSRVLLSDGCLYDLEAEECEEDLSGGEGEKFKGILGVAEDLARVYFVDTGVLTGAEENANGEAAEAGKPNLYAWGEEEGTSFIGRLLATDNQLGEFPLGAWRASPQGRTAQVSPDGRFLAFMSKAPLSGYDNRQAGATSCSPSSSPKEGEPCFEVFEYDAVQGALSCASCNPSGQRPLDRSNLSVIQPSEVSPPLPQLHNLSAAGEGRLFFESQDVLSANDTNGHIQDVYEWEPNGVGSCQQAQGCVSLISSGHSPKDSVFLDSSSSGNDAFFMTREKLLPRDKDDLFDLYDARAPHSPGEAVGFEEGEVAPCSGEACKGPVSSPPFAPSAGSAQFSGPGNPQKQHKQKKHKRKKHKRQHQRSTKHNRGGSK